GLELTQSLSFHGGCGGRVLLHAEPPADAGIGVDAPVLAGDLQDAVMPGTERHQVPGFRGDCLARDELLRGCGAQDVRIPWLLGAEVALFCPSWCRSHGCFAPLPAQPF